MSTSDATGPVPPDPAGPPPPRPLPPRPDTTATLSGAPTPIPAAPSDATVTGAAATPSTIPTGQISILGHYHILEPLGRGGMGVVYKAYHPGLDRYYALKVMQANPQMPIDPIERFVREARAVAKIGKHPHIVQVHDVGQEGPHYYLAMDLVDGGSLDRMLGGKPLPGREAAEIAMRVAEGLQVAHEAGIVHRDLKPSNILMSNAGVPQVSDFGLARDVEADKKLSIEGQVLGTLQYMSPEQAAGEMARIGPLSDVYGLGATLYEMIAGKPPFPAGNQFEIWAKVIETEPEAPRKVNPRVHPDLETICLKCMEKQPERRYPSARAVADDLRRFLAGEPIVASPPSGVQLLRRTLKRHRTAAVAVIAAIVVGLGGILSALGWQARQKRGEVDAAWRTGREAQGVFEKTASVAPVPYRETHAAALAAIERLDKVLGLDPSHAQARRAKFEVAMRFGEVALAQRDFGLATTMFSAAAGLGVDDERAKTRLAAVEEARGEEDRRIRKGLHDLFQEFEKRTPSNDAESGYLPDALQTAMDALALSGGSESGAESLRDATLRVLLDTNRGGETRVLAGVILGGVPGRQGAVSEPLAAGLGGDDIVLEIVAAHALAATADPRWGPPLRAGWDRLLAKGGLSPAEKRLQIELGRAMLIHGAEENVRALVKACVPAPKTAFGGTSTDYAGTVNSRSLRFFTEVLDRATPEVRQTVLEALSENHQSGLLAKSLLALLRAKEPESSSTKIRTESTFTLDALFASPMFTHMIAGHCPFGPWQVVRILVESGSHKELAEALDAPTAWCRGIAAIGLGELHPNPGEFEALRKVLADSDGWVRACATVALARNGDEGGLKGVEDGMRAGDAPLREIVESLRQASPGFETRGSPRELFARLAAQLPTGPPPNAFMVYGALGESGAAYYMADADWGKLPILLNILGRVPLTLRASALRSDTADRALEEELTKASSPIRLQQVLRLMALHRHPRAAEHAREALSHPNFFVQVEAVRTLITVRDEGAPSALARLREAWWKDPAVAGRLNAEMSLTSPSAVVTSAGLYQEILQPVLERMGALSTPEAAKELLEWMDVKWLDRSCFQALDRMGAGGMAALSGASPSDGRAAYARGWIAFMTLRDLATARREMESALRAGYGVARCHLVLGWLDLTQAHAFEEARSHFLEARRIGGGPVEGDATFWLAYVDLLALHRPLEAEAALRDVLSYEKDLPKTVGGLPTLPAGAPKDAVRTPWDDAGRRTPFQEFRASTEAKGLFGYFLGAQRGQLSDGWKMLVEAWGQNAESSHLLPRICEVAFQYLDAKTYAQILAVAKKYPCEEPEWPVWEAVATAQEGKPEDAVRELEKLASEDATAGVASWAIATIESRRGHADAAEKWLRRALELDPGNPRWHRDLSGVLSRQKDWDGALLEARLSAMADPWMGFGELTAETWLRRCVSRAAEAPTDEKALARRLGTLRTLFGSEFPEDPSTWAAWWSQRSGTLAWSREDGRFR